MQIGNRVFGSYDSHVQDNTRLEQTKNTEIAKQSQSAANLSGLKEGAVFKGEILDIAGEKVTIALDNQSEVTARLQAGVELGIGDQLLFSVKENTASQILIKPLFDSLYSAQTQVLERALDMAGLSPTEKNFSAAKELMEAGMPLDKGNMVKVLSQSMKFPDTPMQTLVALNKMNIPVTEANISQYERYQNYSHQLSSDIGNAADSMAAFSDVFSADTDGVTLLSAANEILDIFMKNSALEEGSADIPAGSMEDALSADNIADGMKEENVSQKSEAAVLNEEGKTAFMQSDMEQEANTVLSETKTAESEIKFQEKGLNQAERMQFQEKNGLSEEEAGRLQHNLQTAGISKEQIHNLYRKSGSPEELLKNIVKTMSDSGVNDEGIRGMMESNEFRKLLSDVIKKNWTLKPKDMKDPKEIDELYNKIIKQSRQFEGALAAKGGNTGNFQENFQNMRQNMQFMEQLNHQMIYAQMPLKLSNQNANSELYVYADKRKLAEKKDGISVMLHLDMDHLGQTDIKVTLTGSNVNARFYLNDQQSVEIVADNMNQLAKQLADRGFSLTNEVVKRTPQESINKVVDEIIDENAERSIKRYTFDART